MTALLLASYLATQAWSWSPVSGATSYRLYSGPSPSLWCSVWHEAVTATEACTQTECQHDIPEPPGGVVFLIVTAVNASGEGPLGDGHEAEPRGTAVCP